MDNEQNKVGLTKEQKTGVVLLLVFALIVVGLGFLQMRNTIYGPFVLRLPDTPADYQLAFSDEATRSKMIDTDHDGLTDYDELNSYGTSPYIPDTDSDGIDDKTEIDQGTDPNCPEGQECAVAEAVATSTTDVVDNLLPDQGVGTASIMANSASTLGTGVNAQPNTDVDVNSLLKDPAQLREMVRQSGALTEEQLAKIDDATLMRVFAESAKTIPAPSSTDSNILSGNSTNPTANTGVVSSTTKK